MLSVGTLFHSSLLPFPTKSQTGKKTEEEEYLHIMKRIIVLPSYISFSTSGSTWRQPQQQPHYSGLSRHLWQENNRLQEGFIRAECWTNPSPLNVNVSSIRDNAEWLQASFTEILLTEVIGCTPRKKSQTKPGKKKKKMKVFAFWTHFPLQT